MSTYEPPFNQALLGNPWGEYKLPEYAQALFMAIQEEMGRVYFNREQESWEGGFDPEIEGITWRPYCWDEDSPEAKLPNFVFGEVEIRWYKYPGRGTINECGLDAGGVGGMV